MIIRIVMGRLIIAIYRSACFDISRISARFPSACSLENEGKVNVDTAVLTVANTPRNTAGAVYRPTSEVVQKAPIISLSALPLTVLMIVIRMSGRAKLKYWRISTGRCHRTFSLNIKKRARAATAMAPMT